MEKKDTRKKIIYGIIVIAIVLAVIIIISIVNGNNKEETKNETNPIETNQIDQLPQDSMEMQNPTTVENVITQ